MSLYDLSEGWYKINIYGALEYTIFIEGLGQIWSNHKHLRLYIDSDTGEIINSIIVD